MVGLTVVISVVMAILSSAVPSVVKAELARVTDEAVEDGIFLLMVLSLMTGCAVGRTLGVNKVFPVSVLLT